MSDIIRELEKEQLRTDLPKLEIGDTVRVFVKVIEGSRERLQNFEGTVIKMQGGGIRKTFTVRRLSYGIGVERTFPYNSPRIGRIEVVRHGKVRRAKLYYLRDRVGKAAKVAERIVENKRLSTNAPMLRQWGLIIGVYNNLTAVLEVSELQVQWYPGHMAKARRMLIENLKLIDVVVEIVDARAPLATRNPDFEELFKGKSVR